MKDIADQINRDNIEQSLRRFCRFAFVRWHDGRLIITVPFEADDESIQNAFKTVRQRAPDVRWVLDKRRGDWYQTFSGNAAFPMDPRPFDFDIVDIAHHLSLICRFNGAVKQFYSVAQHSIHVSVLIEQHVDRLGEAAIGLLDRNVEMQALMHDAPEAYVGDMIRPLKNHMPAYREAEDRIWKAMSDCFGFAREMPPCIKVADQIALMTERRDLMSVPPAQWDEDTRPDTEKLFMRTPFEAEKMFLRRFEYLKSKNTDWILSRTQTCRSMKPEH